MWVYAAFFYLAIGGGIALRIKMEFESTNKKEMAWITFAWLFLALSVWYEEL